MATTKQDTNHMARVHYVDLEVYYHPENRYRTRVMHGYFTPTPSIDLVKARVLYSHYGNHRMVIDCVMVAGLDIELESAKTRESLGRAISTLLEEQTGRAPTVFPSDIFMTVESLEGF